MSTQGERTGRVSIPILTSPISENAAAAVPVHLRGDVPRGRAPGCGRGGSGSGQCRGPCGRSAARHVHRRLHTAEPIAARGVGSMMVSGKTARATSRVLVAAMTATGGLLVVSAATGEERRPGKAPAAPLASGPLLGSRDFQPTPRRPMGWRGDWTGRFLGATPPTTWSRRVKGITTDLKYQAGKPDGQPGPDSRAMEYFTLKDWLVAGPYPVDDPVKDFDQEGRPARRRLPAGRLRGDTHIQRRADARPRRPVPVLRRRRRPAAARPVTEVTLTRRGPAVPDAPHGLGPTRGYAATAPCGGELTAMGPGRMVRPGCLPEEAEPCGVSS